ncbi:MAG: hypothetical protein ABSE81_06300 [Candidatus Omnitrophota bacterium]|jgi:hypothetical protein
MSIKNRLKKVESKIIQEDKVNNLSIAEMLKEARERHFKPVVSKVENKPD